MKNKIEILAPAGSYECLVAALKSGADAIYVGGNKFGARANAHNFTEDELKSAIDLVHLHGKQIYLTINTLIKENELNYELYEYLLPLYIHGIDAVIVQDLGVMQFLNEKFPDLPIHASTQMTVTNLLGAEFLKNHGVERVVTSRELSLKEVKEIAETTGMEIESFVHGALCYSYSGQCLFSSMLGDRSGNRGQCAQPCRLPYKYNNKTDYYMSLKDICTLQDIPDLIDAGIYSFKIEGRMKKPEYVASVTSMYRKYVDLYLKQGRKSYKVKDSDIDELRDIFNRGDFHGGYWKQHNGYEMITSNKPSHTGTPVIKVVNQSGRLVSGKALRVLRRGDILEIRDGGDNYTLGREYQIGETVELSLRKGVSLSRGKILYRTRNQWLIDSLHSDLERNKLREKIYGTLILTKGIPAAIHLQLDEFYISVEGELVEKAQKLPLTREKIVQQIQKTGNTPFVFKELKVVMDEDIFVPIQQLNQLRREALEKLEHAICINYRRKNPELETYYCDDNMISYDVKNENEINVYVESVEQFEIVVNSEIFSKIYLDCNAVREIWTGMKLNNLVLQAHSKNKMLYLAMPHVFRKDAITHYKENFLGILDSKLDGFVVRNLESYTFLKNQGYNGQIVLDNHVYIFSNRAKQFWINEGISHQSNALELTIDELKQIDQKGMELMVYGYTPNMISAQCIKKTSGQCTHLTEIIKIKDRMGKEIPVRNCCDYCYNIVYSTQPICLFDEKEEIQNLHPSSLKVNFTVENYEETMRMIDLLKEFYYDKDNYSIKIDFTKGHFRRGVK